MTVRLSEAYTAWELLLARFANFTRWY